MANQANIPVVPAAKVDSPAGGTSGVLFIESTTGVLTLKFPDGTVAASKVVGAEVVFEV